MSTVHLYKQILQMVRPYRVRFILGIVCGVLSGLFAPALPLAAKLAIGTVFQSRPIEDKPANAGAPTDAMTSVGATNAPAGASALRHLPKTPSFLNRWINNDGPANGSHTITLWFVILLVPAVMLVRGILAYMNVYFLSWVGIRAIGDLRMKIFDHVMGLSLSFFNRNSTGDLMSAFTQTNALQGIITGAVATIVKDPVTLVSLVAVLLYQQTKLTLITLVVLPFCLVPIIVYGRKLRRANETSWTNASDVSKIMHEAFTGNRIIRAYNLSGIVQDQFRRTTKALTSMAMRVCRASELPGPMIEFIGSLGVSCFLVYFTFIEKADRGADNMLQFVITIFLIYPSVKSLSRLRSQLIMAGYTAQRVNDLLTTQNEIVEPAQPVPLRAQGADIEIRNVSFSYGDKMVLNDINLTAKAGQLVALVGSSGSGKTTLSNLLLRFYDPQQGSIHIGGVDIRQCSTGDLRAQIAVVTQETILFDETIRRNIELGRPGATAGEIEAAARAAYAYDFIMEKPQGFDTLVGEKGVLLSGGQRQRIAIARAILRNAPILVLDEATNALDTESERAVQAALDQLMQGRTAICIAHRLSTIQHADLIAVMSEGRIVETGKHTELINRGGVYQKLYEMQFRE
jgi:subfamily B ATP-binding cassette protein MsbA